MAILVAAVTALSGGAVSVDIPGEWLPQVQGVVRARYEGRWDRETSWEQRFQVRNARVALHGHPGLKQLTYFVQVDLCDKGKFKFLDAYGQWDLPRHWAVRGGQFRVPFGVDVFRAPSSYLFSNRSFLAKQVANLRQVGARVGWYGSREVPLTIEAGVFNSKAPADQDVWQHQMDFAAKTIWKIGPGWVSGSFLSNCPAGVRMSLWDVAVGGKVSERLTLEAEWQHETYRHNTFRAVNGWNVFASYAFPLRRGLFDRLSVQGRYDGLTDHSNGIPDSEGELRLTDAARQRVTLGAMLSVDRTVAGHKVGADLRLDVEKYFYRGRCAAEAPTWLCAEMVLRF